jgi:hypothetical protein
VCRATTDPGGPRRCSGDTRANFAHSANEVAVLEEAESVLKSALAGTTTDPAAEPRTVSFRDKSTRIDDIRREIDSAIANLNTGEQWQEFLRCASQFPTYSLQNQLLILMQRRDATFVGGLKKVWNKKFNRRLKEGSSAIWIKAPKIVKRRNADGTEEEVCTGFLAVPVYDISDTVGPPLPQRPEIGCSRTEGTAPPDMAPALEKQIQDHGFTVEYRELPEDGPEGWTDFANNKVVVTTRYSDAHQKSVMAHELAHLVLEHGEKAHEYHMGPGGQRPTMEVEAESTAYVISRHFGLNPAGWSFGYIDDWARGDQEKVRKSGERVTKACKEILSKVPQMTPDAA